jgi:hypothetical protein
MAITGAIGRLIQAAAANQTEIVAQGRGSSSAQAFYKRNNRWTEGLLSAARSVAWATTTLIETADGVISGTKSLDQLIVASNEVAAATAQLVQASRVKSAFMSKTQEKLEAAAKAVTEACKALVKQVKAITAQQTLNREDVPDYANMGNQEFKIREMEAQVSIVTLERELTDARRQLANMRKSGYVGFLPRAVSYLILRASTTTRRQRESMAQRTISLVSPLLGTEPSMCITRQTDFTMNTSRPSAYLLR